MMARNATQLTDSNETYVVEMEVWPRAEDS